jgi:hypothetical protein
MAIAVAYDWPVATPGQTTPPASNNAPPTNITSSVKYNQVAAPLTGDGFSTSVTITHNLEITAQELTQSWPSVRFEPQISGGPTAWVISKATNTVTVGFSATVATSIGVYTIVRIERPQTATR